MPRIDETLDKLYGNTFFTTLDLASRYYQIELDEDAKKTTLEIFVFLTLPFSKFLN